MEIRKMISTRRTAVMISIAMVSLFMFSVLAGTSGNLLIQDRIVSSQAATLSNSGVDYKMADIGSFNRWISPSISIDGNGLGYIAWSDQVSKNPSIGAGNYTLNFRASTTDLTGYGSWKNWSAQHSLKNVSMTTEKPYYFSKGFVVGAPSNGNGHYYVLFSNTTSNTSSIDHVKVCLWDGISSTVTTIYTMDANWSSIFTGGALFVRGASAKILFDASNNMNLAWNSGTALYYTRFAYSGGTYNLASPTIVTVNQTASGVMGEFAMTLNSTGGISIVFSEGNSTNQQTKELYWTYRTGAGTFSTPKALLLNAREDTSPDAIFDSNDNLLVTWSQFYSYPPSDIPCNKIMYTSVNSGTSLPLSNSSSAIKEISKYSDPLTVANPSVKPTSVDPSIKLWQGKLDFFYSIRTQFTGIGSQNPATWDFVMQSFADPANLASNHTLTALSTDTIQCTNAYLTTATLDNDIFAAYLAKGNPANPNDDPIHLVKVNQVGPVVNITNPAGLTTGGLIKDNAFSTPLTDQFMISFTVNEPDVKFPAGFKWDTTSQPMSDSQRNANITGGLIGYGDHTFTMTAVDEVGNTYTVTRYITLTGIPIITIITIVLVVVIAVAAVAILLVFAKYRKTISERQVKLKLGGKAKEKGKEGWGEEESEAEEEDKSDREDMDLKQDLKKVDF